ncbi:MAG: DUF349 domain-containing protein [Bacteroidia bacterium]|jgi:hypothetical protein|nr:DUF349 domain-containing protein [Bacteroidia bacterium]
MTEELNKDETTQVVDPTTANPSVVPTEAEMNEMAAENVDTADVNDGDQEVEAAALLQAEEQNYGQLNKQELVSLVKTIVQEKDLNEASQIIKVIKPIFEQLLADERNAALQAFIEGGGVKDDFSFKGDGAREEFYKYYRELKDKRTAAQAKAIAEKQTNLEKKDSILRDIQALTEAEETPETFRKLKDLQSEWKQIKNVPKEHAERLWESYRVLLDKFYDQVSINNELKELDRRKNLDQKIELTKRVTELALETNINKALIMLKKFQEEWRTIGPVPKESNDDIWNRFKSECDKIYDMIKALQAERERKREENLVAKKDLLAQALQLANYSGNRIKEWVEYTQTTNRLMEEWRKIGQVPLKVSDEIWNEFRGARNKFFNNKNAFFKQLQAERDTNLKAKTLLCEKAEAIAATPIDWNKQTDELKKLQDEWKKTGPVAEKIADTIWKRFRTACDTFFEKKAQHYAAQVDEQKQNLETKKALIAKLEELLNKEESANILPELKAVQDEWNNTGFVPLNEKEKVSKRYQELNDKVFAKFRQANNELREIRDKSHFETMAGSPNGAQKLKREEKFLLDKMRGLRNDIDTWENNLGFFSKGSSSNPMVAQIEEKISGAQKQIKQLEEKLKLLRSIINQPKTATEN